MRLALRIPLAILLLACLLPAAAHLGSCADEGCSCTDSVCLTACCQPMAVKAIAMPEPSQTPEQFVIGRESLRIRRLSDTFFRPPEVL